tara:strand:+ start:1019 stop:1477 length:459 start_codon:yes stop_codon:yes gene_type:complete
MIKSLIQNPYTLALVGGSTISLAPTIAISKISELFPNLKPEQIGSVSEFFANGFGPLQVIVLAFIVLIVPPLEEIVFRHWGWRLASRCMSAKQTWVFISVLFAIAHLDLLHILGLLPLSFFLGWLRLRTGDVRASTVAHCANNAVACLFMVI